MSLTQWSDYWATGNLTSLPNDFQHNYDGEIKQFWMEVFERLPKQARILDVCTGNGAIAYMAADYSALNNLDWRIIAVDGADISQAAVNKNHGQMVKSESHIEFISQVYIEEMALPNGHFDLIMSQYGIEYCDWHKAAERLVSHMQSDALFACVTHAPETDISEQMQYEKSLYRFIEKLEVFDTMTKFVNRQRDLKNIKKIHARQHIKLVQKWHNTESPLIKGFVDYTHFMQSVEQSQLPQVIAQVSNFLQQHRGAYQRLLDVLGVAERLKDNPNWYSVFESQGLVKEQQRNIIYRNKHLAGIGYIFKRISDKSEARS